MPTACHFRTCGAQLASGGEPMGRHRAACHGVCLLSLCWLHHLVSVLLLAVCLFLG